MTNWAAKDFTSATATMKRYPFHILGRRVFLVLFADSRLVLLWLRFSADLAAVQTCLNPKPRAQTLNPKPLNTLTL